MTEQWVTRIFQRLIEHYGQRAFDSQLLGDEIAFERERNVGSQRYQAALASEKGYWLARLQETLGGSTDPGADIRIGLASWCKTYSKPPLIHEFLAECLDPTLRESPIAGRNERWRIDQSVTKVLEMERK